MDRPSPIILIVDDNASTRRAVRNALERDRCTVVEAPDGSTALRLLDACQPDLVLQDLVLPDMSGFDLVERIRAHPGASDVPIVALLGWLPHVDESRLATAAFDGLVPKPVESQELRRVVRSQLEVPRTPSSRPPFAEVLERCATLAAELSVLRTVADTLVDAGKLEDALREILVRCLDAAGLQRGAICARAHRPRSSGAPADLFVVRAQHGFSGPGEVLELLHAHEDVLRAAPRDTSVVDGRGAMLVPLVTQREVMGVLLLDAPSGAAGIADRRSFAQAMGRQVSVALALARAFDRADASERRAGTLMEHAEDAIFVVSTDGVILEANRAAERLLGLPSSEIVGRPYSAVAWDAPVQPRVDCVTSAPVKGGTMHMRRADGTLATVECTAALVDAGEECVYLTIARDVTARNALADRVRRGQRLEAIGRLASGIAHDFNNMLSVVISYSDLLLAELPEGDPSRLDVLEIRKAGKRAADLTRQLLVFSRQQVLEPKTIVLNDLVTSMRNMVRRLVGEDVELTTMLAPALGNVVVDATQMHQVIMNLVVNARDAMPGGGRLTISTANVLVPGEREEREVGLPAGAYVRLTVEDTGVGMSPATLDRIFEPFFTTKEPERGTGLGLSTVYGIVQQSGGTIRAESELGRGTRFFVYLPRTDLPAAQRKSSSIMPALTAHRGRETILAVEDEEQVRTVLVSVLHRAGYNVLDASNAGEALLIAEQHDGPIDLLMTDLVMPRMSGSKLAERLRGIRPGLKVLLMSGSSGDHWETDLDAGASVQILSKPFSPPVLVRRVRDILDVGSDAPGKGEGEIS